MGDVLNDAAVEMSLDDLAEETWKKGDKVPEGYKIVFGRLSKIGGGSTVEVGKQFHADASSHDLGLSGPNAEQASRSINKAIQKAAGMVHANRKEFRKAKWDIGTGDVVGNPELADLNRKINAVVDNVVKRWRGAGAMRSVVGKHMLDAWDSAMND